MEVQVCYDFVKGVCVRRNCKYSHDVKTILQQNKGVDMGVCYDFLQNCCRRGVLCRFKHDLEAYAMVQYLLAEGRGRDATAIRELPHLRSRNNRRGKLSHGAQWMSRLERSQLERSRLERSHLERSRLERSHPESHLERSRLEESDLERSRLEESDLERSDLERSQPERSHLERSHLERCHLEQSDLEQSSLEQSIKHQQMALKQATAIQMTFDNVSSGMATARRGILNVPHRDQPPLQMPLQSPLYVTMQPPVQLPIPPVQLNDEQIYMLLAGNQLVAI